MPRTRRRKIEVPTDTQPRFELGDTAEDIERRDKRGEKRKRGTERRWRERERERGGKSARKEERREREQTRILM